MPDLTSLWIFAGTLALAVAALIGVHLVFLRWERAGRTTRFVRQIVLLGLTVLAVLSGVITLPAPFDQQRGDLLGFLGIVMSAAIALSSTTLLGNVLAGFMMRSVRRLQVGDFLHIGEHFGRITERGLLFTEIQTQHSDLIEFPNLYLAQNPVRLLRAQGTIVTAEVSIGYDVSHQAVEAALLRAAAEAELGDPFVLVLELRDFSIAYRVGGMLTEVKGVLSANSRLRAKMLDALHTDGIEIVSPSFMNTRALEPTRRFVPAQETGQEPAVAESAEAGVETIAFEEAESAETVEGLREQARALAEHRKQLAAQHKGADPAAAADLEGRLAAIDSRLERLKSMIDAHEADREA